MSRIIRYLIISDVVILFGLGMMNPIFAVFITENITNGTVRVVGIATALILIVRSLFQIFIADYLDLLDDERRNFWWVMGGSILISLAPFFYASSRFPFQLYLISVLEGFGLAMTQPAWGSLFTEHITKRKKAWEWSVHDTLIGLSSALAAALGGYFVSYLGFVNLFYLVGIISLIGSFILVGLYKPILETQRKKLIPYRAEFLPFKREIVKLPRRWVRGLRIRKYGNPVLLKRAQPLKEINEDIIFFCDNLRRTLEKKDVLGLAAPQVGKSLRIIIAKVEEEPMIIINPKIVFKSSDFILHKEGCLSLPNIFLVVRRPREIEVEGFDPLNGQKIKIRAKGETAAILSHEIDHLDGILISSKVSFWQRWKIKGKLAQIKKEEEKFYKKKEGKS